MELTPLEISALSDLCKRGGTRCNDGGIVDTLLSGLCCKPSLDAPLVTWRMNPNSWDDGYISLYEPTPMAHEAIRAQSTTLERDSGSRAER